MKKIFILSISFIHLCLLCNAQSTHLLRDKKYVQYWESLTNCSEQEILQPDYQGIILNGELLIRTDILLVSTIESITGIKVDTFSFNYIPDIHTIQKIEELLKNENNYVDSLPATLLMKNNYYRQYLGIEFDDNKYVLVSFQMDYIHSKSKRIQKKNFELFKLIYSRLYLFSHPPSWDHFWLLYNTETQQMEFFY